MTKGVACLNRTIHCTEGEGAEGPGADGLLGAGGWSGAPTRQCNATDNGCNTKGSKCHATQCGNWPQKFGDGLVWIWGEAKGAWLGQTAYSGHARHVRCSPSTARDRHHPEAEQCERSPQQTHPVCQTYPQGRLESIHVEALRDSISEHCVLHTYYPCISVTTCPCRCSMCACVRLPVKGLAVG